MLESMIALSDLKLLKTFMNLLISLSYEASNVWKLQKLVRVKGVDIEILAVRLDDRTLKLQSVSERNQFTKDFWT